jgi:hypothetical protein
MVSLVENGHRALKPWLAQRLDHVYETGTMITALVTSGAYPQRPTCATLEEDGDGLVLVELPLRGVTMAVPRRAMLAALSLGATTSTLAHVHDAMAGVPADVELLTEVTHTLSALKSAGRIMPPARLIDSLVGQVAVLEVVRHRVPRHLRRDYLMLQAQYADYLSWMVQESGDVHGASSWVDRVQQWADRARWPTMVAYAHVRRSVMASTCANDGRAAVEHAQHALRVTGVSQRVKGLAAKQAAYGYALIGHSDACHRSLDLAAGLYDALATGDEGSDPVIGLISLGPSEKMVDVPVMLAQFRATCDVSLGGGERAVAALSAYRTAYGPRTRRGAFIGARLARAFAQAGNPDRACALALEALDTGQAVGSMTTRVELRRTLAPLSRWPAREDVAEVRHRITTLA